MRLHKLSLQEACDLANIPPSDYLEAPPSPQSRIKYLPTPAMIARDALWWRENRLAIPDPEFDERGEDEFSDIDNSFWYE